MISVLHSASFLMRLFLIKMLSIRHKSFFRIKGCISRQRKRNRLSRKARLVYGGYHLQRQAAVRAALRRQFSALQETQHRIDLAL